MPHMGVVEPCGLVPNQYDQKQIQQDNSNNNNDNAIDYSQRAQWLRAAVMGANDGLVSVASLMMGVGAVRRDVKAMLLAGFAGSVAGACSMAIGEFVSVYAQYEVEAAQKKRDMNEKDVEFGVLEQNKRALPNPLQAAFASAFSFVVGAIVPLLAAALIMDYKIRLMVVVFVASLTLLVFGWVGALLGKTPKIRSCVRVLVGGWIAMLLTFGLTKLLGSCGLEL